MTAPAKKTAATKAVAKKAPPAKKTAAKKAAPAKKAVAKKAPPAKKAVAKKAPPAKKAVAKKALPAKKAAPTKAAATRLPVPPLTAPREAKALKVVEQRLDSGLRVVAVRKPGIPLVEVRLRVPFLSAKATHPARASVLGETMATGAGGLDRAGIAAAVQGLGGDVSVSVDADRLVVNGTVLATDLRGLLDIVASMVTEPAYAKREVAVERERLVENLQIARARPSVVASEALARRQWGKHPYALELPTAGDVAEVKAAKVRSLHDDLVRPAEAVLVLVGDLPSARMIEAAEQALASWKGRAEPAEMPPLPAGPRGPLLIVDRPGSVQSSLRLAGPGLTRTDPGYPALQLANLIFGGYFSSRWTENIREDKGYTYGPHSRIDHHVLGSVVGLDVEVATEVTGPSWLETVYELGRIASLPVTQAELDSARQYAIGTLALSTATQAGLAGTLSALSAFGLGLDWVTEHPQRLLGVTVEDVAQAAARFFAPTSFTSVVVGDEGAIRGPLAALGAVE